MFTDGELLMLSGIQHIAFCERQYALAYIEDQWQENLLTLQGHRLHERVDDPFESEKHNDTIFLRGVNILSYKLGLYGKADLIELKRTNVANQMSIQLDGYDGYWMVKPVEYKRGKPKPDVYDEVQLCAQVFCLEEMYEVSIPQAEIFYGEPHRRSIVEINSSLRNLTIQHAQRMHQLFVTGVTPKPIYKKHCHSCSLFNICKPKQISNSISVKDYLSKMLNFEE